MDVSAQSIADELMSQLAKQLPRRPLVGGGFHHFVLRASVTVDASPAESLEIFEALLVRLSSECPEWKVEVDGSLNDLQATFTR